MRASSDEDLKNFTGHLKLRAKAGELSDSLLPEAFAACREASYRTVGLRAFDVQLMGAIFIHQGNIVEMQTGEGKTLVATFPAYLNSIVSGNVHVITVNDYLARRDAEWMGKVYAKLGLTVGVIYHGQSEADKRAAYAADITYATFNELGFDYLRDNMKSSVTDLVQKDLKFAIIDEADSVLIDEARTPLVISGARLDRADLYKKLDEVVKRLHAHHFIHDPDTFSVSFTEAGNDFLDSELHTAGLLEKNDSLYDHTHGSMVHHLLQALRANQIYNKNQHYIVANDEVQLVDPNTGRAMPGRRLAEGLHQAIEAKEGVSIQPESLTLASITVQNYFRLYKGLAGMTGTAATDAGEFLETYGLGVEVVPSNAPLRRTDNPDRIFQTASHKLAAVIETVQTAHAKGQPVLVGTTSVGASEQVSALLVDVGIEHGLLNAREHEREAEIVANAGRLGQVTVATNMAGRGTDIQLAGDLNQRIKRANGVDTSSDMDSTRALAISEHALERNKIVAAGGLLVVGVDRNESRRIDNQLRGRAGRQGDPGETSFFISLADELLAKYQPKELDKLRSRLKNKNLPWLSSAVKIVQDAQARSEERNFEIRKQLLKYDDVLDHQRKIIFGLRHRLLADEDVTEMMDDMRNQVVDTLVDDFFTDGSSVDDDRHFHDTCRKQLNLQWPDLDPLDPDLFDASVLKSKIKQAAGRALKEKWASFGSDALRNVQKILLLETIDRNWREHLAELEHLRSVVGYRVAGKRNPLFEYRTEAFAMFEKMIHSIQSQVTATFVHLQPMDNQRQRDLMSELIQLKK
jgi:preprotein translocase subunit SecA